MRRQSGDVLAIEKNLARSRLVGACDHVEQCGFAGAIRPDQAGNRTLADFQTGAVDSTNAAEMHVDVVYPDHVLKKIQGGNMRSHCRVDKNATCPNCVTT